MRRGTGVTTRMRSIMKERRKRNATGWLESGLDALPGPGSMILITPEFQGYPLYKALSCISRRGVQLLEKYIYIILVC